MAAVTTHHRRARFPHPDSARSGSVAAAA